MLTASSPVLGSPTRDFDSGNGRRGELALLLQEPFTAAARLRANRQVAQDAESFRLRIKQLLGSADQDARRAGYDPAFVKLAIYAYVAFLDETVLTSAQPIFAAWPRQPLQEEIFGDHMAGQTFFAHLDDLLGRPDSDDLADLLEVFQLCMLLGFKGRYGSAEDGGLRDRIGFADEKIRRIRGAVVPLAPGAPLPTGEAVPAHRDPWLGRMASAAGLLLAVAVVLFVVFRLSLGARANELDILVGQLLR
jgi:type VI secretion system protein ImpK